MLGVCVCVCESAMSETMNSLRPYIREIPDFPKPGILFRDISPLLRDNLALALDHMSALLTANEWERVDAIAGIEARGFILAAALATRHRKGFVPVRKAGKLPPPVVQESYDLEYGSGTLEAQHGSGTLLIVDDVLATGGTIKAAATLAASAGYTVAALTCLIDLNLIPDFRWREQRVRSALQY
jgi:adenine phosphoribosyltransferase